MSLADRHRIATSTDRTEQRASTVSRYSDGSELVALGAAL